MLAATSGAVVTSAEAAPVCRAKTVFLGAVACLLALPAAAPAPPGTAATPAVPAGSPLQRVLPTPPPAVAAPTPAAAPAVPAAVPAAPVRVSRVSVEGVTAYQPAAILALVRGSAGELVGPAVPLAKIEAARVAILHRYRGDGYVLSAVSANTRCERRAALRGHRRAHRQRQAGRRHRPGRRAGAALPQPADRKAPID